MTCSRAAIPDASIGRGPPPLLPVQVRVLVFFVLKMKCQRRYRGKEGYLFAPDLVDRRRLEDVVLLTVRGAGIAGEPFEAAPNSCAVSRFRPSTC